MHCHLIVSRKDQANKKKLSPLTNHKNTKKGTVIGGFDRINLFQQAEQEFDRLFNYQRKPTESFEYYNTMKTGSISNQLSMQEQQIACEKENMQTSLHTDKREELIANKFAYKQDNNFSNIQSVNHEKKKEDKQSFNLTYFGLSPALGLLTPGLNNSEEKQQIPMKKRRRNRGNGSSDKL